MGAELYPTIQAWLIRARNDLANAEFTAAHRNDLLDTAVYHCQQTAEKALKAFLTSAGLSIPKTHDLGKLVQLATACHIQFAQLQAIADPDDEAPMPTIQQANQALAAARRIYDFVLSILPTATHPV